MDLINYSNIDSNQELFLSISEVNKLTKSYDLVLSNQEISDIINIKDKTLSENNLFEFENNVIVLFMEKFSESCYIDKDEWSYLLSELIIIFYNVRKDVSNKISDETIVNKMFNIFNNQARGSVILLKDICLEGREYFE